MVRSRKLRIENGLEDESDRFALLDLKGRVLNDPLKITSSWNDSTHFCDWIGVTCNSTIGRVVALNLEARDITGSIPPSLGNLSYLTEINLGGNKFQGSIPQEFGRLLQLRLLNLSSKVPYFTWNASVKVVPRKWHSQYRGKISYPRCDGSSQIVNAKPESFQLGQCEQLVWNLAYKPIVINVQDKQLSAMTYILWNLTAKVSGSIPPWITNLINLQVLGLEGNFMNGDIPPNIGNLKSFVLLYLVGNELTGPIPSSIGNLSSLTKFYLSNNKLDGSIPTSLGQCKSLLSLQLSSNNLSGTIPKEILGLPSLSITLALDHNSFTGLLPDEVGGLRGLVELDASENKLSGDIPSNLGKCINVEHLYLGSNQFEGTIPQSLEALKGLVKLNLSSNNLSGLIPQFLSKLLSLTYLDLSYNNFDGEVPKEGVFSNSTMFSILGNSNLCGGLQELYLLPCMSNQTYSSNKQFKASKVLISIAFAVAFTVVLVGIFAVYFMLKKSRKDTSTSSSRKEFLPQISYLELSKSTDRFSTDRLIGSGSFGIVYKGILSNGGSIVAIKVLNLQQQGASKSFVDECNALSNIRHRNLLKVITSCSSIGVHGNEFKALVFNFMSNGNLDCWLHPPKEGKNQRRLSLIQRLNTAIDIACGLDYLHNHCEPPIVHCDLKPSNILLNEDMVVAHVGDFKLARFMLEGSNDQISFSQTMSLALKGSLGYIPNSLPSKLYHLSIVIVISNLFPIVLSIILNAQLQSMVMVVEFRSKEISSAMEYCY
ncbi:unnamed protein product [Citrullus colocynthis]|uniref:Protein kinase domain-containing protein n=1 Tax=Citrullus colocynthis TaxID=252529 RepID=A0ABP0YS31_9ROSI